MLKVTNLKKSFQSGASQVNAINNISFEIPDGQFASIIGKSGSGKSTLLGLLGALDKPTSGSVEVGGKNISKLKDADLTNYRSKTIGFVFQNYNLVPNLTALENVMLPMEFTKVNKKERLERAKKLLEQVGLDSNKQSRKPSKLSGGEQQRVAVARALANKPKLILADEPTGNLDTATGKMIFDLLHGLAKSEKTTIIVVTHDLGIAGRTEKTLMLQDGKLVTKKS
jgi:putative ABC transport system ATP-binding protein